MGVSLVYFSARELKGVRKHDLTLGFVDVWGERLNVRLAYQGVTARLSGQMSMVSI
jgi:hypothetical protein